jgi:hypothetical protein
MSKIFGFLFITGLMVFAMYHAFGNRESPPRETLKSSAAKNSAESEQAIHFMVICDSSDSSLGLACTPEALLILYNSWLKRSLEFNGSSFTVLLIGKTRDTVQELIHIVVPDEWGSGVSEAQTAFITKWRKTVQEMKLPQGGSAIAETLSVGGTRLGEMKGKLVLFLFSDLRQVTAGSMNFEKKVPNPKQFVAWLEKNELLVDLSGIDMTVCGVHPQKAPSTAKFTSVQEKKLREAWQAGFAAMNVTASIFSRCTAESVNSKGGV